MVNRVFNFGSGPATLPLPVLQKVREELLDYQGIGASIIEIGHRSPQVLALLDDSVELITEMLGVPPGYRVLFAHGGGHMQFAMVPMNLIALKPARRAYYACTGLFACRSATEAERYGRVERVADSSADGFDHIPPVDAAGLNGDASYFHIVTNNTVMGTRWMEFPDTADIPLVGDATSELFSRAIDVSRFGLLFAGVQKNLGPAGLAVVIVRENLLGSALPETPSLLDYSRLARDNSLTNTINVFALYVTNLVLNWLKKAGGIPVIEELNERKARRLYSVLDRSDFYRPHAQPEFRASMNITFDLPSEELNERFILEADSEGLYKLKGHKERGGIRASIYNAMTMEGVQALAAFMEEFERRNG